MHSYILYVLTPAVSLNSAEDCSKLSFCYFKKTLLFFITDCLKCGNTAESEQQCLFHDILGFLDDLVCSAAVLAQQLLCH